VRYRIEYLTETTEESSICHAVEAEGYLDGVELLAQVQAPKVKLRYGADGFQVRDLGADGRIVILQTFVDPLCRFWPHASNQIVH
jgi:hypothetical protein